MSELKDILSSKEITTPKDGSVGKKEKSDDKNKKPEKLSLPLDS
jgi:hypothetical protein